MTQRRDGSKVAVFNRGLSRMSSAIEEFRICQLSESRIFGDLEVSSPHSSLATGNRLKQYQASAVGAGRIRS